MSIQSPGQKPFTPPINPKTVSTESTKPEEKLAPQQTIKAPVQPGIGRGPELDAHAIATRLAIMAAEAKEKELKFEDIIDRVIQETGMTNPQSAMEEASRRKQKEIEDEIVAIKANKELMDEAEAWEQFADILTRMDEKQAESFMVLMKETIRSF